VTKQIFGGDWLQVLQAARGQTPNLFALNLLHVAVYDTQVNRTFIQHTKSPQKVMAWVNRISQFYPTMFFKVTNVLAVCIFGTRQPIAYWLADINISTMVGGVAQALCKNPVLTIHRVNKDATPQV